MKKPLEIWQAIIATALLLIAIATIIVQQSSRITRDEVQIGNLIENKELTRQQFQEVNMNLKEMNNKLTSILVALEDKADRDNKK